MLKRIVFALFMVITPAWAQETPRIIDGDTFELRGKTIRLNGIDAPEHGQRCGSWNCGAMATEALARLIEGEKVSCVTHTRDAYGRDIATCTVRGRDVGAALVQTGVAWAFRKYSDVYAAQELDAKAKALGIWSGRRAYETPWDFRAAKWAASDDAAPEGCPIKGNISKHGRIYHPPWSPWYSRTRINEAKGERWFCNEAEAKAAGWRAPYWR
jgi:endonuclease YncB( thermonuclease family)